MGAICLQMVLTSMTSLHQAFQTPRFSKHQRSKQV